MTSVGLYNIKIDVVHETITSDLSDFMPWELAYAFEEMILTHWQQGIDVSDNAYQQGILDAVNSIKNNLK